MYNPDFIIYSNNRIKVTGAKNCLRIVALNKDGSKEFNVTTAKRVRVYDFSDVNNQKSRDFDIPSHIGGGGEWTTNDELADAIRAAFPAAE